VGVTQLLDLAVGGLTVGMIYALIALGYTMVYGVLEFINFAHGEVFTIGAYLAAFVFIKAAVQPEMPALTRFAWMGAALAFSVPLTALLGLAIERVAYRPLRGSSRIIALLSAIGVSIILQNLIIVVYGPETISIPSLVPGFISVAGTRIRLIAVAIIVVSIVLMAGLTWLIRSTRIGKAMRATSQDGEAAEMMGIDTNRTIAFTFLVGSALAAVGGFFVVLYYGTLKYDTGFLYGLKAFTAAVLGGIGSIPGAVIGSLTLGLAEVFGVGAKLGVLAIPFAVGLLLGLYVQFVRAPKRRLQHVHPAQRTPAYQRELSRLYRLTPIFAVRRVLSERTDALLDVSARHALRLMAGNLFLAAVVALFALNAGYQIDTKWQNVIAFAGLMLILLFRPSGILGENLPEKV
jgi:branched-chain amino acid transport system permease protein